MANVIIQIYGIRTIEDARMVIDMGAHHIGVSYGKIKRTPGQLTCEQAKEIFEGVQPHAIKVGLTVAYDIDEISGIWNSYFLIFFIYQVTLKVFHLKMFRY